jgi:TRAP-type mannitol/chloroaromatic compound transport system permease small subunit
MTSIDTSQAPADQTRASSPAFVPRASGPLDALMRVLAVSSVALMLLFLVNAYLTFWQGFPGAVEALGGGLEGDAATRAWIQLGLYLAGVAASVVYVLMTPRRPMTVDSEWMSGFAAYLVRAAFWATLLVGLADMVISFLRVEELLAGVAGEALTTELGRPNYRGSYVHVPLMLLSLVIAFFVRSLGFIWLALLVVFAEFQIVISRFVFSYEQAFMGDLVRFWYAALFLFASAYTLIEEGHVRVDVFYARFSPRGKAWANALGSAVLGLPICWVILTQGMWGKGSSLIAPLLSFEISQSGYGLYTKYLMAAFLLVFAVTMLIQFASYFLANVAVLRGQAEPPAHHEVVH